MKISGKNSFENKNDNINLFIKAPEIVIEDPISNSINLSIAKKAKSIGTHSISLFDLDQYELGYPSPLLEEAVTSLMCIAPTSTSCERTFSSCGQTVTPTRSKMSSEILDSIIVANYYLLN